MQQTSDLVGMGRAASEMLLAFWNYLPQLIAALAVLAIGWLAAALLRAGGLRLMAALQRRLVRSTIFAGAAGRFAARVPPALIPSLLYWAVLLGFVAAATQILGLNLFADWLSALLTQVPGLLAAALVVAAGFVTGQLARDLVTSAAASAGLHRPDLMGMATLVTVQALSAVIGLELVGLDATFLVVFAGLVVGTVGAGIAISFGIGAQTQVSNLLGARDVREHYSLGQRVRIGEWEGVILDITPRAVVIEAAQGRVRVPARLFAEQPSTLLEGGDDDD